MFEYIVALILAIAAEVGVPPNFALAIAQEENRKLDPMVKSLPNEDGSIDLGVMQLNSKYFGNIDWWIPEINILAGCLLIKELMSKSVLTTWWSIACSYNTGYTRFIMQGPPKETIDYANRVMHRWHELEGVQYINPIIRSVR